MTEKGRQFFFRKKIGVTPSLVAPGDTHPSDATGNIRQQLGIAAFGLPIDISLA